MMIDLTYFTIRPDPGRSKNIPIVLAAAGAAEQAGHGS
jgi:hypothetical protein